MLRTSFVGAALDPRGDRRRSHLITAGNAHVVRRQRLQPRHFRVERRRRDVDQPGHRHLSFSLTHLFDLEKKGTSSVFCFPGKFSRDFFLQIFTRMWHFVRGEKPSCPGLQLSINLLDCVSVTTTSDTGLGATAKHRKNPSELLMTETFCQHAQQGNLVECLTGLRDGESSPLMLMLASLEVVTPLSL